MGVSGTDGGAVRREILRLMAAGLTDEAIAGRLGISARSARRHIAAIMDALGAVSRFQAGAEAARRGWLTGPAADLTAPPPGGQNAGRRLRPCRSCARPRVP